MQALLRERIGERLDDVRLPDQRLEVARPVLAREHGGGHPIDSTGRPSASTGRCGIIPRSWPPRIRPLPTRPPRSATAAPASTTRASIRSSSQAQRAALADRRPPRRDTASAKSRPRAANRPTSSTSARSIWRASSSASARRRSSPTRWPRSPEAAPTPAIAQDTIAMAVNDLITVGATPLVVQAYWAAGGSDWFDDAARAEALVDRLEARLRPLRRRLGRRRDTGARRHRRGRPHRSRRGMHRHRQPEGAPVARRPPRAPATRSCCSPRAASTPTASAWRASSPSGCRAATSRRCGGSAVPITFGEALLAPTVLYSPITEALHQAGVRPTTRPTSPATAGAS